MQLNRNYDISNILGNLSFFESNIFNFILKLSLNHDNIRNDEVKLFSIYFKLFINIIYLFKSK